MLQSLSPAGVRIVVLEMFVIMADVTPGEMVSELAVPEWFRLFAEVYAGLVKGYGVEGGQHPDVRKNRGVILRMTVAIRRDIGYEADVEARSAVAYRLGIFSHLSAELLVGVPVHVLYGVEWTGAYAAAAAFAEFRIDVSLAGVVGNGVRAAFPGAALAKPAFVLMNDGLSAVVLMHLAGPGTAAHADIFYSPSEACGFMTLEVRERNEDVSVHDGVAYEGRLAIFSVLDRYLNVIGSAQTVSDYHRTACRHIIEAVDLGAVEMVYGILPRSRIESVAVSEKRLAAQLLHHVSHSLGIVRAQIGYVSEFAKMHLYGHELAVHVDSADTGPSDEFLKFCRKGYSQLGAEIRKKHFRGIHKSLIFILVSDLYILGIGS